MLKIKATRLPHFKGEIPSYISGNSSAMDISAQIVTEHLILPAGARALIPTGLILDVPIGYQVEIMSKNNLAFRNGLVVLNTTPIDCSYKSEIHIALLNSSKEAAVIKDQDKIAQLALAPVYQMELELNNVAPLFPLKEI